jgi:hypothetical protein
MKKYRTSSYANGGVTGGKKKPAAAGAVKTRAQEIEEGKMIAKRKAEDMKVAEKIRADVRTEVGAGAGRASKNVGNVPLSMAKTQEITSKGARTPAKYTRGELAAQFGGQKQQPIYLSGETLGYAPEREIKRGAGFTMTPRKMGYGGMMKKKK